MFRQGRMTAVFVVLLGYCQIALATEDSVESLVEALRIRDHLLASQSECQQAALERGRRRVAPIVESHLRHQQADPEISARLENLYRTHAREACYIGIEQDIIARYERIYAAALSTQDIAAAVEFLSSPHGARLMDVGIGANQNVLPLLRRRQETQTIRADTLLQERLNSLLIELTGNGERESAGAKETR